MSDFVKAGGEEYKLLFDNCHNAADRMMNYSIATVQIHCNYTENGYRIL